jgi:hypothetical protein
MGGEVRAGRSHAEGSWSPVAGAAGVTPLRTWGSSALPSTSPLPSVPPTGSRSGCAHYSTPTRPMGIAAIPS